MALLRLTLFSLLTLAATTSQAQKLDGLWVGHMIIGGLDGTERLPMQLYLTMDGRKAKGRTYVQLPDGEVLRMDLEGQFYRDGSMKLEEVNFAGDPNNDIMPEFSRQYQISLSDDIWNPRLKGYWQEITEEVFKPGRRLGRMVLKREEPDGA